jgi:hypothetical protein
VRKETHRLPLPHLQSVIRKGHRNAESVIATDLYPVELITVSADEAPIYLSIAPPSQPETFRVWDNRTWRAVTSRRQPVAIADFGRAILHELSENRASLQGANVLRAQSTFAPECPFSTKPLRTSVARARTGGSSTMMPTQTGGIREFLERSEDDRAAVRDDLQAHTLIVAGEVYRAAREPFLHLDQFGVTKLATPTSEDTERYGRILSVGTPAIDPIFAFSPSKFDQIAHLKAHLEAVPEFGRFAQRETKQPAYHLNIENFPDGPYGSEDRWWLLARARGLQQLAADVIGTLTDSALHAFMDYRARLRAHPSDLTAAAAGMTARDEEEISAAIVALSAALLEEPDLGLSNRGPMLRNALLASKAREEMFGPLVPSDLSLLSL